MCGYNSVRQPELYLNACNNIEKGAQVLNVNDNCKLDIIMTRKPNQLRSR